MLKKKVLIVHSLSAFVLCIDFVLFKWEINQEYIEMITRKYYPGTFKLNKNKLVSKITYEEGLSTKELKVVVNELKRLLTMTEEIYNDSKIENAVRIVSKRSQNKYEDDLIKAAYKHLNQNSSDKRKKKATVDIDQERLYLFDSIANICE